MSIVWRAGLALACVAAASAGAAGCGNAYARSTRHSPNLMILNGTDRTVKVYVVEDEHFDPAGSDPLDTIGSGGVGKYVVEGGQKKTVLVERQGGGHRPHRRARLRFHRDACHVLVLGVWLGDDPRAIVERNVTPGVAITWDPPPGGPPPPGP